LAEFPDSAEGIVTSTTLEGDDVPEAFDARTL
jgi:hypothetical protein